MKTIHLKRSTINIPECWEDVPPKHIPFVFRNMILLFANEITPFQFKLNLLIEFTGYMPAKTRGFWFGLKRFFYIIFYRLFLGKERFREMLEHEAETQENIQFNLIQLAERFNFAFELEESKIIPNYYFARNPIVLYSDCAPVFDRDVTVETNITAKQYTDCMDLLQAYNESDDVNVKTYCMNKIMCVLYGFSMHVVKKFSPEIPFCVMYWFTGIIKFFREHSTYSILYSRKGGDDFDPDKINLGLSETMLFLEKEGYSFVEDKNIIDFFNAQIKALKDSINNALASGIKLDELAQRTGLTITDINRLSNE